MTEKMYQAVSLFTGAGIGDIGFRAAGFDFTTMLEKEPERAQLAELNYPEVDILVGDIWNLISEFVDKAFTRTQESASNIFLASCTAPCQGMSKSGQGTLLRRIREGKRPKMDPRNRLILPALEIIRRLNPQFVVFENVCEMKNTVIEDNEGEINRILDIILRYLGKSYEGEAYEVEFADYGIPQRRKRLITVYTRNEVALRHYHDGASLIPEATHSQNPSNGKALWVPVWEAIKKFPPLDAKNKESACAKNIPFHRVSVLDPKKYDWIKHTSPGSTAFDNQCINPNCGFQGNRTHGSSRNGDGINQSHKDTPLYCEKCGDLLPRPYTVCSDGSIRIMSGYTSAYKRMDPNLPAPALTRNMSFPCSDNKVHPFENRVLSIAECFVIHTLDRYEYVWGPLDRKRGKTQAPDTLIRLALGESIPPRFTEMLGTHLKKLTEKNSRFKAVNPQMKLFSG